MTGPMFFFTKKWILGRSYTSIFKKIVSSPLFYLKRWLKLNNNLCLYTFLPYKFPNLIESSILVYLRY